MGFFSKKDKSQDDDLPRQDSGMAEKKCFNCGKKLKEGHYTKANDRYCCEKCCSSQGQTKETCEFC